MMSHQPDVQCQLYYEEILAVPTIGYHPHVWADQCLHYTYKHQFVYAFKVLAQLYLVMPCVSDCRILTRVRGHTRIEGVVVQHIDSFNIVYLRGYGFTPQCHTHLARKNNNLSNVRYKIVGK